MVPDPAAPLTVDVVRTLAELATLEPDFDRLQSTTGNTLPFLLFEWQLAWCTCFLDHHSGIDDEPLFQVVRRADRTCVALIPLIVSKRRLGPLRVASVGLLGADPAITEVRTALVQPGYEAAVALALHRSLEAAQDWDWIQWTVAADSFSEALGRLRSLTWEPVQSTYVLDLPATWAGFRAGLKRNIRESLRHCYNSLQRDGHHFELTIATDRAAVAVALDRLFELHTLRADMTGTVDHPDRFASTVLRRFVHEVCGELAARGCVRVFQIEIGGAVVASRIGFVVGDGLYLYYSGFDPAWSRYSVMTTAVAEAIKYAIDQGLKTVNLSSGTDGSKTRWSPRAVGYVTAYEHSGRWRSRLVRHAYVKARSGAGVQGWLLQRLLILGRRSWN